MKQKSQFRKIIYSVLLLASFCCLASCSVSHRFKISGRILDELGKPIVDAQLQFNNSRFPTHNPTTDEEGNFTDIIVRAHDVDNDRVSTWVLHVRKEGYLSTSCLIDTQIKNSDLERMTEYFVFVVVHLVSEPIADDG